MFKESCQRRIELKRNLVFGLALIALALVALATVHASTPLSPIFFDHFTDSGVFVNNWVSTGMTPTGVGSSIVTLAANSALISKPLFHHGVLAINASLANSTMTSALWGWGMQFGSPTFDTGAFYCYNGTTLYAIIGNATDPANQQIAAIPAFNVQNYMEYVIEWSYSSGYTPYFTFRVNGGTYTLLPTGSLQMLDYFSSPIVFMVRGSTSAAKLNIDYVGVSDTIVIVQSTTSTQTVPATKTETVTTTMPTTVFSTTTVPATATSTSWTWASTTYTYTVPSYTTVGVSTVTRTLTATTTSTSTVTKASTTTTNSVTETLTGYVVVTGTTTSTATTNTTTTATSTVEAVATVFGFLSLVVVMGVVTLIAGVIFATRQRVSFQRGRSQQPV